MHLMSPGGSKNVFSRLLFITIVYYIILQSYQYNIYIIVFFLNVKEKAALWKYKRAYQYVYKIHNVIDY